MQAAQQPTKAQTFSRVSFSGSVFAGKPLVQSACWLSRVFSPNFQKRSIAVCRICVSQLVSCSKVAFIVAGGTGSDSVNWHPRMSARVLLWYFSAATTSGL